MSWLISSGGVLSLSLVKKCWRLLSGGVEITKSLLYDRIFWQILSVKPRMYLMEVAGLLVVTELFPLASISFWIKDFGNLLLCRILNAIRLFCDSNFPDEKV
jgi:hypothetical protein